MFGSEKILWKHYPISTIADDGTLLEGEIVYWSKDYSIKLCKPFKAESYGAHLMYTIPANFIVDKNDKYICDSKNGFHQINLYSKGLKKLKELYKDRKK